MSQASEIFNDPKLLEQLKSLMQEADSAILDVYHSSDLGEQIKENNSPVTQADLATHQILVKGLTKLTPKIPVVSEEDNNSLNIPNEHSIYWLIDPLDGTKEFINRNDEFTCNLALIENNTTTLGFVTVPVRGELYFGGQGLGASLRTTSGTESPIRYQNKPGVTRIVASKSHLNEDTRAFIDRQEGTIELIQAGSSLKFLKIATGEADLYPRLAPTCEWDTAAAQAVLEGAGGKVLQAENLTPLRYGKKNILNPHFIACAN
ncbi:3'(2'),5'-bisphosphate nucleotidase CysQ [Neptuniibacter sp. QD37_6]|uniref:3'(2'),5'-bisphosphate nucleotidase CysQ n=1 Tax=Neptuniibacter sp. QD37_6 TaxID=3398210 RepID=UPI0039F4960E